MRLLRSTLELAGVLGLIAGWLVLGFVVIPLALVVFWVGPPIAVAWATGHGVEGGLAFIEAMHANVLTYVALFGLDVVSWALVYGVVTGPFYAYYWWRDEGSLHWEVRRTSG